MAGTVRNGVLTITTTGEADAQTADRVPAGLLNARGAFPPLIALRTWKREVPSYYRLAQSLGPDQPICAIAPPQGKSRADFPSRVSQWLDFFLPTLREFQPHGPYRLGGWSFGGLVALSAAERLRAEGEEIERVVMFDTRHPKNQSWHKRSLPHEIAYRLNEFFDLPPTERGTYCRLQSGRLWRRETKRLLGYLNRWNATAPAAAADVPSMSFLLRSVRTSFIRYKPFRSDLPVTLYWTEESREREGECLLGWSPYLRGAVQIAPVPGDHNSMFDEPHIHTVARELREALRSRERAGMDRAA